MEKPDNGKKTMGRRKIEIKKIEKKTSLQVAFTKRRGGLFRKASELAVLCGAEVAILVQSPADKLFAFGHPSVEALINRVSPSPAAAAPGQIVLRRVDDGRIKYEEAMKMLEMEKRRAAEMEMGEFWWERPHEGMELNELEEFLKALEDLGDKVAERVEEFQKLKFSAPPLMQQFGAASNLQAPITAATNGDATNGDDEDLIYFHPNMEFQKLKFSAPPLMQQFGAAYNLQAPITAAAATNGDDEDLIYFHPNMHAPITAANNGDDQDLIYFHPNMQW